MTKYAAVLLLGLAVTNIADAERAVRFTGDFESGEFQRNGGLNDSFYIKTLPSLQTGEEVIATGSGGGGPASNWDTKIVASELVGGQVVSPRRGNFFARSVIAYGKDYRNLNGGVLKKARTEISAVSDVHRVEFDTEAYVGFSIFVPNNFEHETGTKGVSGSSTLFVSNTDSSADFATLRMFVPKGGEEAHWFLNYPINPYSIKDNAKTVKWVDLGSVNDDRGKWTDFVIRFRANPFSVTTNPADKGISNANDRVYEGNKGILQLWKGEGVADGNGAREMVLKVNVVNSPVGNVPGNTQGKSLLGFSLRIYKFKWQTMPTSVGGPVWFGYDEFRFGEVIRNGTGYSDVHPLQLACTDGCSADSPTPPPADPPPPGNPPGPPPGGPPGQPPGATPAPPPALVPDPPENLTVSD